MEAIQSLTGTNQFLFNSLAQTVSVGALLPIAVLIILLLLIMNTT